MGVLFILGVPYHKNTSAITNKKKITGRKHTHREGGGTPILFLCRGYVDRGYPPYDIFKNININK